MAHMAGHEGTCLMQPPALRSTALRERLQSHSLASSRAHQPCRQTCHQQRAAGRRAHAAGRCRAGLDLQGAASALASAVLAATLAFGGPAHAVEPFLSSTGARGPLADEEAKLLQLRVEAESEVRQELQRARQELEEQGKLTQNGKLCATPFGVDVVGITELVALTGALVGGVIARQRKNEVEELNERLRKINLSLRQQARVSTMYAPGLTYAPRGRDEKPHEEPQPSGSFLEGQNFSWPPPAEPSSGGSAATATMQVTSSVMMSMDEEELSPDARKCISTLREGKKLLKDRNGSSAMVRFEKALMLAKSIGERVFERRSMRGLAAAARLQGQLPAAVEHLERVLEISKEIGDHVGDADAHGTIADIYTDMGQFDKAAKSYDLYIRLMSSDGPV